jgi:hypothetical protein
MEWNHEEAAQESSRRGSRQVGRLSPERRQNAGEPRKWPQGWLGQKPQEENCRSAKRPTPTAGEAPQGGVSAVIASIRARFGYRAIGLGYGESAFPPAYSAEPS